eukprot:CAMPEP_0181231508 /NCGR_PEP_ID=MMETSP1096-20121128/35147_1 /TAXON_ID=156174 ORGANISM="Chrysochromulina ericina, Strain CCMP281" /NCGR_SAMPLE_ID=MMETSP1096 /ASSEMBLY_ACC=CAM_ASM_000453 /LENGTH=58 /DNA_ID=CAMNT_0023325561 /DNA_START=65 /DNA_END=237 /DNA_ORIENTATION=-
MHCPHTPQPARDHTPLSFTPQPARRHLADTGVPREQETREWLGLRQLVAKEEAARMEL